jgi:perosamine synthetase
MENMDTLSALGRRKGLFCGLQDLGLFRPLFYVLKQDIDPDMRRYGQFIDRNAYLTYQGRGAIALLCSSLGIGPGDEVLMPAYNCGTEVDPFIKSGATVIPYRVDFEAKIDLEDIRRRATDRTRILYATHYFGWPQDIQSLAAWSKSCGVFLVEDCALSLFSSSSEGPIGVSGEAAIFAFPKTLPVPDGGALTLGERLSGFPPNLRTPDSRAVLRETLPLLKRSIFRCLERAGIYPWFIKSAVKSWRARTAPVDVGPSGHPSIPESYNFDRKTAMWAPSRITKRVLHLADEREIVHKRRENYLALSAALAESGGLTPLFSRLPPGVCPLAFPLIVENRSPWVAELNARGIAAIAWWSGYHRELNWDEFPEASYLKDHLVTLPVHQRLTRKHIEYIGQCVNEISKGLAAPDGHYSR